MICKWCKTPNLQWKEVAGRWALFYETGQRHLCRATRDKLVKKIGRMTPEQFWSPEAFKQPEKKMDYPPMPENFRDSWWNFLDAGEKVVAEAIP